MVEIISCNIIALRDALDQLEGAVVARIHRVIGLFVDKYLHHLGKHACVVRSHPRVG